MSIKINSEFAVGAPVPIDSLLTLSYTQMLSMNDNIMPDVYLAICKDDGKIYVYNKTNTPNIKTGKFIKLNDSGEGYQSSIEFHTHLEFPNVGDSYTLYIATDENITYRWDSDNAVYVALNQLGFDTIQAIL